MQQPPMRPANSHVKVSVPHGEKYSKRNYTGERLPMSNPRSNREIAHLLEHLDAAEFPYPGTYLRLVYSIAGEPETPNLAPHQNPADQEV